MIHYYFSANVKPDEKLAVLVFVHGGGFSIGSSNDEAYGPDFLIEQNVILVTMNYRLGMFGFMSLGTRQYSGNMGLKDQQLALKWIHSNIKHFSGDHRRILLFGQSAGAASAHFHVLSSESRKYFRNAALLSGTAENLWAIYEGTDHLDLVHKLANQLSGKKPNRTFEELIEFMETVPAEKIVGLASIMKKTVSPTYIPVIESELSLNED